MVALQEIAYLPNIPSKSRFLKSFSCHESILLTLYILKHKYEIEWATNRQLYEIIIENSFPWLRKHTVRARLSEMERNGGIVRQIGASSLTETGRRIALKILRRAALK